MKYLYIIILLPAFWGCSSSNDHQKGDSLPMHSITSPAGSESEEPYLFTSSDGDVIMSWIKKNDGQATLLYSRLQNDLWSKPTEIASGSNWFVNWADYPMIAMHQGQYLAHYLQKSGEDTYAYDVMITQSKDGKDWSQGKVLNTDSLEAEHGFVSILPYKGHFLMAWLDGRNTVGSSDTLAGDKETAGAMSIRAALIDYSGIKTQEWELDNRVCDCCQTGGAITDNGPVIVYRDRSNEEIRDMSIVRMVDGEWTEPKAIHNDNWKIAGCPVNGPRVDALGNALAIAWYTSANGQSKVKIVFSQDGGATLSEPIEIAGEGALGRVDVVMKDEETAFASWLNGPEIRIVEVSSSGVMSEVYTVAQTSPTRSSGFPQLTNSGSDLIMAWTDDSLKQVLTARIVVDSL